METFPEEVREGVCPLVYAVNLIQNNNHQQQPSNSSSGDEINHQSVFQDFISSLSNLQTAGTSFTNTSPGEDSASPSSPESSTTLTASLTTTTTTATTTTTSWARIVAVSKKHAFPPSKDPDGSQNRSSLITRSRATDVYDPSHPSSPSRRSSNHPNHLSPVAATEDIPTVDGILPSGWLEKHAHALPSVLLIVTYIDLTLDNKTANQEDLELAKAMDQLRYSLASKRECRMHLVCCILPSQVASKFKAAKAAAATAAAASTSPTSISAMSYTANQTSSSTSSSSHYNPYENNNSFDLASVDADRFGSIRSKCRLTPSQITTLQLSSNGQTLASLSSPLTSPPNQDNNDTTNTNTNEDANNQQLQQQYIQQQLQLKRLHRNVQDSANAYYLAQARRAKRKLTALHVEQYAQFLPLAARYCFKIATFYEFQNTNTSSVTAAGSSGSSVKSASSTSTSNSGKNDKSVQYWMDGYRYLEQYYKQLMYVMKRGGDMHDMQQMYLDGGLGGGQFYGDEYDEDSVANESVEVALAPSTQNSDGSNNPKKPSLDQSSTSLMSDMAHQCRILACWLNYKIIQAVFISIQQQQPQSQSQPQPQQQTNNSNHQWDIGVAESQWRKHYRIFLQYTPQDVLQPRWYYLSFLAKERLIMAQLGEYLGSLVGETQSLFCSSWRQYTATVEDVIRLHRELQRVQGKQPHQQQQQQQPSSLSSSAAEDINGYDLRHHYEGSIKKQDLVILFEKEQKRDHLTLALQYALKAISLCEQMEVERKTIMAWGEQQKQQLIYPRDRSISRTHFLAGGLLLGQKEFLQAKHHFEMALTYSSKWSGIEHAILKGISKCQENLPSEDGASDHSETASSMLFNASINKSMSIEETQKLHDSIFYPTKPTAYDSPLKITWSARNKSTPPFTFALTFPHSTHATAGDYVTARISLKSHLTVPISITGMEVETTVGLVKVEQEQISSGSIAPNQIKYFSAQIPLPMDLVSSLPVNEPTVTAPNLKIPGKPQNAPVGSVGKSIKVRTSGLTQGGGGYYLPQSLDADEMSESQDHIIFGGVPVTCSGITLTLEAANSLNQAKTSRSIELTLNSDVLKNDPPENNNASKNSRLPVFEKVNYIDIAWDRPDHHSLSLGPRCVRVLRPLPKLKVNNITSLYTEGKVMEGVVNRIMLQVEAGPNERCSDIQYSVTCTNSTLFAESNYTVEGDVDRPPFLVIRNESMEKPHTLESGSQLPDKWQPHSSEKSLGSKDVFNKLTDSLEPSKSCYLCLDLFRPSPQYEDMDSKPDCQTDFDVVFSYKQVHALSTEDDGKVTRHFKGSVVWYPPLDAKFCVMQGKLRAYPCGSHHPSNQIPNNNSLSSKTMERDLERESSIINVDAKTHVSANNGDEINIRCSLEAKEASYGLGAAIEKISFKVNIVNLIVYILWNELFFKSKISFSHGNIFCSFLFLGI